MSRRLTQREWRAILEALSARLAGEIEDVGDLTWEDYERAAEKTRERISYRASK